MTHSDDTPDPTLVALAERARVLEERLQWTRRACHKLASTISSLSTGAQLLTYKIPADSPLREAVEDLGRASTRLSGSWRQLLGVVYESTDQPDQVHLHATVSDMLPQLGRTAGPTWKRGSR